MITEINVCKTTPFNKSTQILKNLKKFNYLFGANGSGKTTISRIIAAPENYADCSIVWKNNTKLETRVYNRDFVERNFQTKLKGVFTLGAMEADTITKIEQAKEDIKKINVEIEGLAKTLQGEDGKGGKRKELADLTLTFKNRFWRQKQKHAEKLGGGMAGTLGDSARFMSKVLSEADRNKATLLTQTELEEKAATIFSSTLVAAENLSSINTGDILTLEKDSILQKRIIGKEDVDIAAMIRKLGNSDWVRQGLAFFRVNDSVCPFCQQTTSKDFEKSLNEYFDETFTKDVSLVNKFCYDYSKGAQILQQTIQDIIDKNTEYIDTEKLKSEKQLLDLIIAGNLQNLKEKQKETSRIISLKSLKNVLSTISELIIVANKKINDHNTIINNIRIEKEKLTNQIWRFIVSEASSDIAEYNHKKKGLDAAIDNLIKQIQIKNNEKRRVEVELNSLEKQTTSIIPARDGINALLSAFGFRSFKLEIGDDQRTYKLKRENGTDAHQTLSEGEKNFVTFLYFYYLLKGSHSETGITNDKVVVFDDPISSLDNDVLFIVSTLIRELVQETRDDKGTIRQIFVLTHNIYFHKEVTFNRKRNNNSVLNEETFWLVKKQENCSIVERQTSNPIKTSYELLWDEARKESRNNATIQNTLRRILENYFKLLGGIPLEELYLNFDGDEKLICKALCSWVHDGSHSAFEDFYSTPLDDTSVQKYLDVFQKIFDKSGQISHYNMMMGDRTETGIA